MVARRILQLLSILLVWSVRCNAWVIHARTDAHEQHAVFEKFIILLQVVMRAITLPRLDYSTPVLSTRQQLNGNKRVMVLSGFTEWPP